jgi:hypothetical protein
MGFFYGSCSEEEFHSADLRTGRENGSMMLLFTYFFRNWVIYESRAKRGEETSAVIFEYRPETRMRRLQMLLAQHRNH